MFILDDIRIYPVKSLGGVSIQESMAKIKGLKHDRRMMLTDHKGDFLSQRTHPDMALFNTSINGDGFCIRHKDGELFIPLKIKLGNLRKVKIWDDIVTAPEADKVYSAWFSDRLKIECHLMIMTEAVNRKLDPQYSVQGETVSFSDGFPYLLTGTASLDNLNGKLEKSVPMDRFRPNLVINTDRPFAEDHLDVFRLGDALFKRSKPCARCVIITTDQSTGERGREPLHTLSKFRKKGNKVLFGQNLICLKEGKIKTGDALISVPWDEIKHTIALSNE